jgi:hypothetical protein
LSHNIRKSALATGLPGLLVRCLSNSRNSSGNTGRAWALLAAIPLLLLATFWVSGCATDGHEETASNDGTTKQRRWCHPESDDSEKDVCGEWSSVAAADPAPPGPTPPYTAGALRQDDCSLTREILDANFVIQAPFTIPNYQDVLHQASGLTTTPDQFKNGCTDLTTGIASQHAAMIGPFSNGNRLFVGLSPVSVILIIIDSGNNIVSSQAATIIPAGQTGAIPFSLAVADLNHDGNMDIVVASSGFSGANAGQISVLLGTGNGAFAAPLNITVVAPITGVTVDDMNADGKLDLIVVGLTLFDGGTGLEFLPGKGDGTFGTAVAGPDGVQGLVAISADFNNDGKKDIATSRGQILLGKGDGTFTLQAGTLPTLTPTGGNPNTQTGITAGDFNHDGKMDLAVTNAVALTVDLYFGNGDGTFTYQESYPSLFGQQTIQSTDIDGDGNPDLFVGTLTDGAIVTDQGAQGLFLSLLNNGTGKMAGAHAYLPSQPAIEFPVIYDAADFNGDHKPDLVSIGADASNSSVFLSVLKGNGDGTFASGTNTPITIGGLSGAQAHLQALVAGDFDGDGKIDVAFAYTDQSGTNTLSIALGNGDGTFKSQTNIALPAAVVNLISTDLNGDKKLDFAFIADPSTSGATTGTQIYSMLNNSTPGNISFGGAQLVDAQPNLGFIVSADLNGDGNQDLAATSSNIGTSSGGSAFVYLGKGDGSFKTSAPIAAGIFPGPITVADLTGDGKLDLLIDSTNSDLATGTLTTLPGVGDGTFGPALTTAIAGGDGSSIAMGTTITGNPLHVLVGSCCGETFTQELVSNGDGTFADGGTETGTQPLGISAQLIKLIDINGDGLPDLLEVSNQYAIEVFLNLSGSLVATTPTNAALTASAATITFGQSVTFTATVTPQSGTGVPTGTVTFFDGGTSIGTGTLNVSGVATLITFALVQGTRSVTANYAGDANFSPSVSAAVSVQVNGGALISTTTTLSGPTTAVSGTSVTYSANVTPASGTAKPTGTVTFLDGATSLGTGTLSAAGVATLSTTALSAGAHTITAKYGGDANFATSTSSALTITISAPALIPTVTTLTGPSSAAQGASVTFMVSVTPTSAQKSPTGIITFLDGTTSLGTATLNSASAASFSTSSLTAGAHSITAQYPGDTNFAVSTSLALAITISGVTTPNFVLSASAPSVTVTRNQPGVTTITATPSMSEMLRGRKSATNTGETLQFSCTGLPPGVTCAFAPPSLTLESSAASTQLTISEGTAGAALARKSTNALGGIFGRNDRGLRSSVKSLFLPALGCEFMLLAGMWRRKKTVNVRDGRIAYAGAALLILATVVGGCSGGSGQQTPAAITINATVGNQVVPLPLKILIQN